jgi:predicted dehydrogenase/threonine dehydrogenase-like Zn-dependent dehydrogenase
VRAVLLSLRSGSISVEEVPAPQLQHGQVLVRNEFSLISAGTERATLQASQASLIGKARERPDQARMVLDTLRQLGPAETYRIVSDRLDAPTVPGYSSAGTCLEVGAGVDDLRPGMRVAAGGVGYACHAEVVAVPKNLCVAVPAGVSSQDAAFTTVGAIALQGIHQAEAPPGSRVAVVGLGLVGQLTVRLLSAYGYDVVGIDREEPMLELARLVGVTALARDTEDLVQVIRRRWGGADADAVLVTAATGSPDPVEFSGQIARDRANVVIVGDVNVAPPRSTYYGKELSIRYSRSYGPGRYDPRYEEGGQGYPEGYVPWPLRRNMEEFLRLVAGGVDLSSLGPVVFPVDDAAAAYSLLDATGPDRRVAILLGYERAGAEPAPVEAPAAATARPVGSGVRIAALGAGSFPTRMLFPYLKRRPAVDFAWLSTGRGFTAPYQARRWGFADTVATLDDGLARGDADCVMVLDRHATHAEHAARVLRAGVGVFCEKPLALGEQELEEVAEAWLLCGAPAMVGFNRRFAPAVQELKKALAERGPRQVVYRVFGGRLKDDHWLFDPAQGGRLNGEVCHFIDTASFLTGSTPSAVLAASIDAPSDPVRAQSTTLQISYQDGSSASIIYGGLTPRGAPKESIEVAADGLAARIDDFRSLTVWKGRAHKYRYRGGPKGHAQEMAALVDLLGGKQAPEADFVTSLWTTLATCRAAASIRQGQALPVQPSTPALAKALGVDVAAPVEDEAGP